MNSHQMFNYRAYELDIASEFECPGLPLHQCVGAPDVTIVQGDVPESLDNPAFTGPFYQVAPHDFLLRIENVARYRVSDGCRIIIDPCHEARQDDVRLFLLGSAMGALLYQCGVFPLHGSAVETDYGVMIFVGPSGIGKSTLAAVFQQQGYRLLSDDVCALVRDAAGEIKVLPAFPQLRLCPDAYERFGDTADMPQAHFDQDKYIVPLADGYTQEPARLGGIYLLADHDLPEVRFKHVTGFHRVGCLLANLYRPEYLRGMAAMETIMEMAGVVAGATDICELLVPRDTGRIDECVELLEDSWQEGAGHKWHIHDREERATVKGPI